MISKLFTVLGFGSALALVWLALAGAIKVNPALGVAAFLFFILLGFGGAVGTTYPKKKE